MARGIFKRWAWYLIIAYIALWVLTAVHGPAKLQAQMLNQSTALSERIKKGIAQEKNDPTAEALAEEISGGPHASADLLSCPLPLYFRAETKSAIGDRYQMNGTGWYFYTPWRVYAQSNRKK
jgi:hypothetical protein